MFIFLPVTDLLATYIFHVHKYYSSHTLLFSPVWTFGNQDNTDSNSDNLLVSPQTTTWSSLDNKAKFAANIFRLSGMELGHILQVLDLKCPNALEHPDEGAPDSCDLQLGEAQVEINVDAIDPRTFAELDRYVKDKMLARTSGEDLEEFDHSSKKRRR